MRSQTLAVARGWIGTLRTLPRDAALPPHGPAYIRLPGLPPRAVAQIKYWRHLVREGRVVAASRDRRRIRSALRAARRGFYPSSIPLYDLDGPRARDYVSDHQRELSWVIDWPAAGLLDDKLAFFFMLRHFGVPTPEVAGVVVRGRIHRMGAIEPVALTDWLPRWLEERGRLVIRPNRGTGGMGLWVVAPGPDGSCLVNGAPMDWEELERQLGTRENQVMTEFVEQGGYAREVFPQTTNTVRVLTMQDPSGRPFVAVAVHRFGMPDSGAADNWTRGGLSAEIDVETGVLGPGVQKPRSGALTRHDVHPATGARLTGLHVPGWTAVRDGVLAAAAQTPFLPFVGWDVIVTDDGFSIIEGNKNSDVNLLQVHRPLLGAADVRAFYTRHRVA